MTLLERALVSGSVAAAAVSVVVSLAGRRVAGSSAAPLNATSHFLWGDEQAARQDGYSVKYTGTGFAANYGASVFWALFYEALAGRMPPLARGAAVSALAYVTDYHIVPKRLTPGFELRLPKGALAAAYVALALGLSAGDLLAGRR
jgi:hypothetical protein